MKTIKPEDLSDTSYSVVLFYKYVNISNPEKEKERQLLMCKKFNLTGRLIIAREGINGTLEGEKEDLDQYCNELSSKRPFKNIDFKFSPGAGDSFPKLSVKVRPEIVTLRLGDEDIDPKKATGKPVKPDILKEWIENDEVIIVDMRNDYEWKVGRFAGSTTLPMKKFRDLPKVLDKLKKRQENKKIVTVCTGGVRCEKASGYLLKNNIKDVYQLKGGIVRYMEKYGEEDFKGKLYVFDKRVVLGAEFDSDREIVGRCQVCKKPSENYVNCANKRCNLHFIYCQDCLAETKKPICKKKNCRNLVLN